MIHVRPFTLPFYSFSFETTKDTAGCRALYRNYIVGDEIKHNPQFSAIEYRINRCPVQLPKVSGSAIGWEWYIVNRKSSVRCKVEHPYRIVKNIIGFQKTVYRGLRKNLNRLYVLFASANLYMLARAGGFLRPAWGSCPP